jgi:hypothetical protein
MESVRSDSSEAISTKHSDGVGSSLRTVSGSLYRKRWAAWISGIDNTSGFFRRSWGGLREGIHGAASTQGIGFGIFKLSRSIASTLEKGGNIPWERWAFFPKLEKVFHIGSCIFPPPFDLFCPYEGMFLLWYQAIVSRICISLPFVTSARHIFTSVFLCDFKPCRLHIFSMPAHMHFFFFSLHTHLLVQVLNAQHLPLSLSSSCNPYL